ncbi:alpha-amylase family glycosyl hydrolase [Isoptericola sp. S6320L]|uniref:carbohydrate-binding module family 20 domain-containing protein n=1 Tax=Isoptericola sp. S6320L TaxID=2926411 RepID=UPI001FF6B79A|nr:carbohydrate-binding module family 20 domain-containing protein [Isoptericola sp. S6320L]MCK0118527.1 alpha-amylase family glycosyl hydrolase [Isoptericola sp. S6320L]
MRTAHQDVHPGKRPGRAPLATLATTVAAALALVLGVAPPGAQAQTPPNDGKDVILNLFQWTWDAVAAECTSEIGPAGFGYVQVSPPAEHVPGDAWWTSYQPVSYQIESKLGTRAEFAAMVSTCNAAGVEVIADAVVNHMAGADSAGYGVAGSPYAEDSFPMYSGWDFNDCRSDISNYQDRWEVQHCRLVALQDLRTSSTYVRETIAAYLDDLVSLGVAGFRIDAAKHVPAADLEAIKAAMDHSDVYWVHEVIGAAGEPVQPSEYLGSGDSHEFDYARELKHAFDANIASLRYVGDGKLPSDRAGVFVSNHDTERNGESMSYQWGAKYTLANVFLLSWPYGSPTVYSGYTFSDYDAGAPGATSDSVPDAECSSGAWTCEQRWTEVQGMVGFHNTVGSASVTRWWDDGGNHVAYGRGSAGYVTINNNSWDVTRTYATDLPAGEYCDVVAAADCSVTRTVAGDGTFTATVPAYGALALHVGATSGPGSVTPQGDVDVAVEATTTWGQDVRIVGSRPELGSWDPASGVVLSADGYPVWTGTVDLPAGASFEYKYVKVDGGDVDWESGGNRTATVGADGSLALDDTWRS